MMEHPAGDVFSAVINSVELSLGRRHFAVEKACKVTPAEVTHALNQILAVKALGVTVGSIAPELGDIA